MLNDWLISFQSTRWKLDDLTARSHAYWNNHSPSLRYRFTKEMLPSVWATLFGDSSYPVTSFTPARIMDTSTKSMPRWNNLPGERNCIETIGAGVLRRDPSQYSVLFQKKTAGRGSRPTQSATPRGHAHSTHVRTPILSVVVSMQHVNRVASASSSRAPFPFRHEPYLPTFFCLPFAEG